MFGAPGILGTHCDSRELLSWFEGTRACYPLCYPLEQHVNADILVQVGALPSLLVQPVTWRMGGTGKWRTDLWGGGPKPVEHRCLGAIRESLKQTEVRQ